MASFPTIQRVGLAGSHSSRGTRLSDARRLWETALNVPRFPRAEAPSALRRWQDAASYSGWSFEGGFPEPTSVRKRPLGCYASQQVQLAWIVGKLRISISAASASGNRLDCRKVRCTREPDWQNIFLGRFRLRRQLLFLLFTPETTHA